MVKNYLKIAYRNLKKSKVYTFVNLIGLSVGLAAVFLIALYIEHELNFDRFVKNSNRIYRVITEFNGEKTPTSVISTADIAEERFPEILNSTVVFKQSRAYLEYQKKKYGRYQPVYTDEGFLEVFDLKVLSKSEKQLLKAPNSAVITSEIAAEVFGDADPLNNTFTFNKNEYQVVGVIKDIPDNFHLQFDVLLNINALDDNNYLKRVGNGFGTYFLLNKPLDEYTGNKISQEIERHVNDIYKNEGYAFGISFQPLKRIHLYSDYSYDYAITGNKMNILVFSLVGIFILVVAVFNFLNLSLVKSSTRTKEIAVRKVNGANKRSIKWQFITENILLSLVAFLIAMLLVESFTGDFSDLTNSSFSFSYKTEWGLLLLFGTLTVLIGFLAGLYPAYHVAAFSPLKIFTGDFQSFGSKKRAQTAFVVLQFVIAIALITSVIGLQHQVNYLTKKPLGYDSENVIAVHGLTPKIRDNFSSIREELSNHTSVQYLTASMRIPGMRGNGLSIRLPGSNAEELVSVDENLIKPGFLETYGIKLLQGRDFQKDFASDRTGILINETTARKLGIENPVGKEALVGEFRGKIIGVFQDCHFRSLHHKIEPFILTQRLTRNYWISVKPEQGSTQMALSHLQNTLESYDPAYQFQYMFVDNYLERNYISDKENVTLVFSGTFLAIIISLMGLFALTAFNVEQRIKEIGIRKSLGASVDRIVRMFLSQYLKWIILASLLAFPLSYWFIERWFQEFAYHAEIRWWFFVLAFLISVSIATVTIWLKSYKAARQNPVDTLRYE